MSTRAQLASARAVSQTFHGRVRKWEHKMVSFGIAKQLKLLKWIQGEKPTDERVLMPLAEKFPNFEPVAPMTCGNREGLLSPSREPLKDEDKPEGEKEGDTTTRHQAEAERPNKGDEIDAEAATTAEEKDLPMDEAENTDEDNADRTGCAQTQGAGVVEPRPVDENSDRHGVVQERGEEENGGDVEMAELNDERELEEDEKEEEEKVKKAEDEKVEEAEEKKVEEVVKVEEEKLVEEKVQEEWVDAEKVEKVVEGAEGNIEAPREDGVEQTKPGEVPLAAADQPSEVNTENAEDRSAALEDTVSNEGNVPTETG